MNIRKFSLGWIFLIFTMVSSGCGQFNSAKHENAQLAKTGCVQGSVLDGATGSPIALNSDPNSLKGVFLRSRENTLMAYPQTPSALGIQELAGDFLACNVPLDEKLPIFARIDGYQFFESEIIVESTVALKANEAVTDIQRTQPTLNANIVLFPVGVNTQDFRFFVTSKGLPVSGAKVYLKPGTSQSFTEIESLPPKNSRTTALLAETSNTGEAIFKKEELVLGGQYTYWVEPPKGGADQLAAEGRIIVGLLTSGSVENGISAEEAPYFHAVELDNPFPALKVVSMSSQTNDHISSGEVSIVLNRPFEIVPGTEDQIFAQLKSGNVARLKVRNPGNGKTDDVEVTIVGNILTLRPIFDEAPDAQRDLGLEVVYSGIQLRPTQSPGTAQVLKLQDIVIDFFGGVTPQLKAAKLNILNSSANPLEGDAGEVLKLPLVVQVLDQYGKPFKESVSVYFEVSEGEGYLSGSSQVDSVSGNRSLRIDSEDANGTARAYWRLGGLTGRQSVKAKLGSPRDGIYAEVAFFATARQVATSISVKGSLRINGLKNSILTTPIEVQVLDQQGKPFLGEAQVLYSIQNGCLRTTIQNDQECIRESYVKTNGSGGASLFWKLGTNSNQSLWVQLADRSSTKLEVKATASQEVFVSFARGHQNLVGVINTPLPQPVVARIYDHNGDPIADTILSVSVTMGDGVVAKSSDFTNAASTLDIRTDARGEAIIFWKLGAGVGDHEITVKNRETGSAIKARAVATAAFL